MKILLILFFVQQSSAVIFHLNLTEYSRMPDLYLMDDYDTCLAEPDSVYCAITADLYSTTDSELMQMIQEYSEHKVKHYNHTMAHRALCVKTTCKDYLQNRALEVEADLRSVLEECVNNSMWNGYKLNARLSHINYCKKHGEKRPYSAGDYIVGAVYALLIFLNAIGTFYDVQNGDKAGNPLLLAFSMRRNWTKLMAPSGKGPEPRLNRLQVFNGIRTLTTFCVYFSHTYTLFAYSYLKNPYDVEIAYDDPVRYIMFNGWLVTYTFFVMSGFMVAFNFEIHAEKHPVSLWDWPRSMLLRWLRLTPTYALLLFTVMTLNRHFGDGPQWDLLVTSEADECNRYWWTNLLYINNYIYDNSNCFLQCWYLAADTQLFGLGLLLCILFRKPRAQIIVLAAMLTGALAVPAAHVYYQGVDAVVYQSPENYRTVYQHDDTFRLIYVRAHTILSTYLLGIAGGLLTYHWLENEKNISARMRKYTWILWLSVPFAVSTILSGGMFYMDHFEPSTLVKVLYASVHKPLFQFCMLIIIIGCIFKVETVYRGILEWRGFTLTARLSYAGYLLHMMVLRGFLGSQRLPVYMSDYNIATILSATIFLCLCVGALLFVMVESPLATLVKTISTPSRRKLQAATGDDIKAPTEDVTKV